MDSTAVLWLLSYLFADAKIMNLLEVFIPWRIVFRKQGGGGGGLSLECPSKRVNTGIAIYYSFLYVKMIEY